MNTATLTNADGTIITISKIHHSQMHYGLIGLAILGAVCIGLGLYLLFRKEK